MIHNQKIGVLGGGQLGRMLAEEAIKWGVEIWFMDKDKSYPAGEISQHFDEGDITKYKDVMRFGKTKDIISIEIENVNVDALASLEKLGKKVYPQSKVIALIQDKGLQKSFYEKNDIPTAPFFIYNNRKEIFEDIQSNEIHFPFVQKIRTGGYDGKGVQVINGPEDLSKLMEGGCVIEPVVDIAKELSVIVVRNEKGEVKHYPVTEMVFDPEANLVNYLFCPAEIKKEISVECIKLARKIANTIDIIGILAIEMFLDKQGNVMINEMAPRTHNSGHHTTETCVSSQFEQHLRCLLDLPLGSTRLLRPGVMLNLLGDQSANGAPLYEGFENVVSIEGVYPHIYGKKMARPFRKMGHINIIHKDLSKAKKTAEEIRSLIKVKSYESS